jgi:hypothetical protein
MPTTKQQVATAIAAGRVAYGAAMAIAPRGMLKLQTGDDPTGPFIWLARIFGIRDLVLGAGAFVAPEGEDRNRWVTAGVAADSLDLVSTVLGGKLLGRRSQVLALGVAGGAAAAGAWAISKG